MANANRPTVTIYTDGGADPNPGPGGWGVVLLFDVDGEVQKQELSGGELQTTNNRMELTAAIEALRSLKQPYRVEFFTDSQYLQKGISEWMANWKKTNFKNGKIQNAELWVTLDREVARHTIRWHWVKGHSSSEYNERADVLATRGRAHALGQPPTEDVWLGAYRVYLKASAVPGSARWAAVVEKDGERTVLSGHEAQGVANRLYVLAAINGLNSIPESAAVYVYTDNDYLRNGIERWIKGWKRNGWRTQEGGEVKHRDLWERLDRLAQTRNVKWSSMEGDALHTKLLADALKQTKTSQSLDD